MHTFVVRVFRSEQVEPGEEGLRGVLEEISTGFEAAFRDSSELVAILTRRQRETASTPQAGSQPAAAEPA